MLHKDWYKEPVEDVFEYFDIDKNGLTEEQAGFLLKEFGPNKLPVKKPDGLFKIFFRQFQSPLIYVLLVSCLIVFAMNEYANAIIIFIVLFINATIGTFQEGKAQDILSAIKKFTETNATVLRNGTEIVIKDEMVVPADIIILNEGDKIPADARIIYANNFKVDESALTGESEPVLKTADKLNAEKLETSDQKNMVFKGTYVVSGTGKAVVVATGKTTIIGKISFELESIDTEMPLKANIFALSKMIIRIVIGIATFTFIIGIAYGNSIKEMFSMVVAMAVSATPEGLPVVVTLILATGVSRMAKRNALVKKLQAVEALGQAKIIALDKTGTITKNQMMVTRVFINEKNYQVTGDGYEPKGDIKYNGENINKEKEDGLLIAAKTVAFVANANVAYSEENKQWERKSGDPTDAALLTFAKKLGIEKDELLEKHNQVDEIPFSSKTKYHITTNQVGSDYAISMLSAPEVLLNKNHSFYKDGKNIKFDDESLARFQKNLEEMAGNGLRVIALGVNLKGSKSLSMENLPEMTVLGLLGIRDVIRTEVSKSIDQAQQAGIKVVMITGDHASTAKVIASEAGIYKNGDRILTGLDMDNFSIEDLADNIHNVTIFARVTPEHKLKIIEAYRLKGDVVAMTGDGVNDALSLVSADLGIAMGKNGTEVAKEASDIVLLDDNFSSIVSAIEEGRNIYRTIKKVIFYLFSTSAGEILTIISAILLYLPLPINPAQIIWLNFVTDGFLVVALAFERKDSEILREKFQKPSKWIGDKLTLFRVILTGTVMTLGSLFVYIQYAKTDFVLASTMVLTFLAVSQWFNAWNARSESNSIFGKNFFKNKWIVIATVIVICLQTMAVYAPFMQNILKTKPLNLNQWLLIITLATIIIFVEEIRKLITKSKKIKLQKTVKKAIIN